MNTTSFVKKILQKLTFFQHIHFTQIMILVYGTMILTVFAVAVLGWNTYLFIQSISPLETVEIKESKKISITSQNIDEAINIIDQRQQRFEALLKKTTGTTTISF